MSDCGGYWIGTPGHLIRIDGSHAGLTRSWRPSVRIIDGGLAPSFAFRGTRRPGRQWVIGLDMCTPDEIAGLHELLMSPAASLMMVDPWAQVTNVLSPEASVFVGAGTPIGGYDIQGGGHVTRAVSNPAAVDSLAYLGSGWAPVIPGRPVTASALVAGTLQPLVTLWWRDAKGSLISTTHDSPRVPAGLGSLRLASVTATPPANAVAATVTPAYAQVAARAQITWTDTVHEWGIGGAALRCVIEETSDAIEYAVPGGIRRTSHAITVTEVGV